MNGDLVTINDIKAQYKYGGLFTNKYEIIITPPNFLFSSEFIKKLRILAKSAPMPKKELKTISVNYKGRPLVFRSQQEFGNTCTVSVYEDSEMEVRKTLERWIDKADNLDSINTDRQYYNGTIQVYQLNGKGKRMYGVEYREVFLTSISEITYQADSGELLSYDLTFAFSNWVSI